MLQTCTVCCCSPMASCLIYDPKVNTGQRRGQEGYKVMQAEGCLRAPPLLQRKWNETEEKPAVVAITLSAFVAVWAASGVVDAVDRLPLIGGLLEFVGLIVTGWCVLLFVIRWCLFPQCMHPRHQAAGEVQVPHHPSRWSGLWCPV